MNFARRVGQSFTYRSRNAMAHGAARLQALETRIRFGVSIKDQRSTVESVSQSSNAAVVITTFQQRQLDFCLPLVRALRAAGCTLPIVVVINGEPGNAIDPQLRALFLRELAECSDVQPISLRGIVGLARMWNLGIQAANSDVSVLLNDDLIVDEAGVCRDLESLIREASRSGLAVGNGSWSMFALHRNVMGDIGWFDERLLGFGEEDGDYSWRFRAFYGRYPSIKAMPSFTDLKANTRQDLAAGAEKYSLTNRIFTRLKFEGLTDDMRIESEPPPVAVVDTPDFYPGETFRQRNEHLLHEEDPDSSRAALRREMDL